MSKIDLRKIQWMNLFENITRIKPDYCFEYNDNIIFLLKRFYFKKIKKNFIQLLEKKLGKKIKIIATPNKYGLNKFLTSIIKTRFNNFVVEGNHLIIYAQKTLRASIIGKNKTKLKQLLDPLSRFFKIKKISVR